MNQNYEFNLTPEDKGTALWRKLDDMTAEMLASHRRTNDADKSEVGTANLRGRISELKKLRTLLAMDKPSPAPLVHGESPVPQ